MQTRHILIATGAKAHKLPIEGAEHSIISDHVLDLPERPKKMAIVGGGYIAVEFAGIFNNYGTDVHLVYRQVSCCPQRYRERQVTSTLAVRGCDARSIYDIFLHWEWLGLDTEQ